MPSNKIDQARVLDLDDYRLDMAPSDTMLITRHRDRPGTVGRVGLMLGEADINISAMHLARTRPREDEASYGGRLAAPVMLGLLGALTPSSSTAPHSPQ